MSLIIAIRLRKAPALWQLICAGPGLSAVGVLLAWPALVLAHNGAVTVARSLVGAGMAVDGRLDDWPPEVPCHRITLPEFGDPPSSEADYQACFRVVHDAASEALWVAVEVEDESIVMDPGQRAPWNAGDGCEVYVAARHEEIDPPARYWVRSREQGRGGREANPGRIGTHTDSAGARRIYEFRLNAAPTEADTGLARVIGFDVAVLDRDQDGSFSWIAWGRGAGKFAVAGNLGDLLLVPADLPEARVQALVEDLRQRNPDRVRQSTRAAASSQVLLAGVPLVLALLHLSLFLYYPRQVKNLYYAAFTAAAAVFIFSEYETWHWNWAGIDPQWTDDWTTVRMAAYLVSLGFLLCFLYAQFYERMPRQLWLFAVAIAGSLTLGTSYLADSPVYVFALTLPICAEGLRVVTGAMWRRQEGAWFLGLGFTVFLVPLGYYCVTTLEPSFGELPRYVTYWGFLGVIVSMSAYLARSFATTSRALERQLVEVKELSARSLEEERQRQRLEAENARKTQELEEARRLQLSMLPQERPEVEGLEVAWQMETATEVGGDYYDYSPSQDGTLTLAVGDATGHGMQAGVVVAVTKGLFQLMADEEDLATACATMSRRLRGMHLGRAGMALALARVGRRGLRLAAAGMPPLLVFRAGSGQVDELLVAGMPLGYGRDPPYEERSTGLGVGDVVLLMSDGLPERQNLAGDQLGYERVRAAFAELAPRRSAAEICDGMAAAGERWAAGQARKDDVTLVALRVTA